MPPPANPTTPSKTGASVRDAGRDQVARLNKLYNLGVPLTEEQLSPANKEKRACQDANFRRHNGIVNLLRFHYHTGTEALQAVLDDFDDLARQRASKWVRKPRGVQNLVPRSAHMPVAPGTTEQHVLQQDLLDILEASKKSLSYSSLAVLPTTSIACKSAVRGDRHAERPSIGEPIRSIQNYDPSLSKEIDNVAVHARPGNSALPPKPQALADDISDGPQIAGEQQPSSQESGYPSDSSTSIAPEDDEDPFVNDHFDSQTTVDIEDEKPEQALRRSLSQESFDISTSDEEALDISFNSYNEPESPVVAKSSELPGAFPQPVEYPALPKLADLRLSDHDAPPKRQHKRIESLLRRLGPVFPATPDWLKEAQFPIIWEMTRISTHCGVDLNTITMNHSPDWADQSTFRKAVHGHPMFAGKQLPEASSEAAWNVAMSSTQDQATYTKGLIFAMELNYSQSKTGPLYSLKLRPLSLGLTNRLSRQFGSDRFIEMLIPSPHSNVQSLRGFFKNNKDAVVAEINQWLVQLRHAFVGRKWAAFFVKNDGFKATAPEHWMDGDSQPGKRPETAAMKRAYLFAESTEPGIAYPIKQLHIYSVLDWLLQFNKSDLNRRQPYLKFFSRIALGLSQTTPTLVFEPHQIIRRDVDILSTAMRKVTSKRKVMNDGVARMSQDVARKLKDELELADIPTAVQARIGSAKGMWVLDTEESRPGLWIETFPSQRKWECDMLDDGHRTLEIKAIAAEPHSAYLNLQFIPILEEGAPDKQRLRSALSRILAGTLGQDLEELQDTVKLPILLSSWIRENSMYWKERTQGEIPFLGGLPNKSEDVIQFLLAGGFDPLKQKLLWDKVYDIQKQNCNRLLEKLHIKVGRSAYLLMVVDFLGVLEEDEVHICFSSKFQVDADSEPDEYGNDGSFSDTQVADTDVLVARSPAHFASDVQKVHAVYRKELRALKDVIVFSSKGKCALADKLSGGDYDGDRAWVCWDPRLVDNFENTDMQEQINLRELGCMRQVTQTLEDLSEAHEAVRQHGSVVHNARKVSPEQLDVFLGRSFSFNMQESLLGKMTACKEKILYDRGIIADKTGQILSTLVSDLVDQEKQGFEFTMRDFHRLCKDHLDLGPEPPTQLNQPAYRNKGYTGIRPIPNLIDYLKFDVAEPRIKETLRAVEKLPKQGGQVAGADAYYFDSQLVEKAKQFEKLTQKSPTCKSIWEALKSDLYGLEQSWVNTMGGWSESGEDVGYRQRVLTLYEQWQSITARSPRDIVTEKGGSPTLEVDILQLLLGPDRPEDPVYSGWALLCASQFFRMFYRIRGKMVWTLAGRQLQHIKGSFASQEGVHSGTSGAKVLMTAAAFAFSRPDSKIIKQADILRAEPGKNDDNYGYYEDDA